MLLSGSSVLLTVVGMPSVLCLPLSAMVVSAVHLVRKQTLAAMNAVGLEIRERGK